MLRPDGSDATPKSAKTQAIIAMLAVANGDPIERSTLQDHLWSDRMQKQGRDSLRQALSELRSTIGADAHEVLKTQGGRVSLNMSRVRCHLVDQSTGARLHSPRFLEGLDARDPVFEEWLRTTRSRLESAETGGVVSDPIASEDTDDLKVASPNLEARLAPALDMPATVCRVEIHAPLTEDASAIFVCNAILDDVSTNLRDLFSADVFDLRNLSTVMPPKQVEEPSLSLQVGALPEQGQFRLQIRITEAHSNRSVWSHAATLSRERCFEHSDSSRLSLVSQITERMISAMRFTDHLIRLPGAPYQALTLMFWPEENAKSKVDDFLTSAQQQSNDPVYCALAAYQETLSVGETNSIADRETQERVSSLIRRSLDAGKFDSTYLSTAGYALHYLTGEDELAADLLIQSAETGPCQALCWDHLAIFYFDNGKFRQAREASIRALALGVHSRFRFAYETTRAMIAHAEGDHATAILFGRRALQRRPGFSAALRYTTASLALSGKYEDAGRYAESILEKYPDFRAADQTQGLNIAGNSEVTVELKKGLLLAGLPL